MADLQSNIGNDFPSLFIHLLFIHIAAMGRNCQSSVNLSLINRFDEDLVSSQSSHSIFTHCKWWYWSYFSFLHKRGVVLWVCSEFKARLSRSWFHSRLMVCVYQQSWWHSLTCIGEIGVRLPRRECLVQCPLPIYVCKWHRYQKLYKDAYVLN